MSKFTREVVRNMRETMIKEMQEVAKKYGVTAEFGSIRFSDDDFGVKMTVKRNMPAERKVVEVAINNTNKVVKVGSLIAHPARKNCLEVVNITARGSVFVVSNRGARYRLTMEDAQKYLVA